MIVPATEMVLPLKIAFIGRSFLTGVLRTWIGFGATFRELLVVLDDFRDDPFELNLDFGGAIVNGS